MLKGGLCVQGQGLGWVCDGIWFIGLGGFVFESLAGVLGLVRGFRWFELTRFASLGWVCGLGWISIPK